MAAALRGWLRDWERTDAFKILEEAVGALGALGAVGARGVVGDLDALGTWCT